MRVKKETIQLAKIRRLIRDAIHWNKVDNGMPNFWSSNNWKNAKMLRSYNMIDRSLHYPYYIKSDKAIEDITRKILKIARENDR